MRYSLAVRGVLGIASWLAGWPQRKAYLHYRRGLDRDVTRQVPTYYGTSLGGQVRRYFHASFIQSKQTGWAPACRGRGAPGSVNKALELPQFSPPIGTYSWYSRYCQPWEVRFGAPVADTLPVLSSLHPPIFFNLPPPQIPRRFHHTLPTTRCPPLLPLRSHDSNHEKQWLLSIFTNTHFYSKFSQSQLTPQPAAQPSRVVLSSTPRLLSSLHHDLLFASSSTSSSPPTATMRTAKVPPAEALSSSRRQPIRQTRTNPPRAHSALNGLAGQSAHPGASVVDQPIDIFPGVTHFADAITALPKELVRHFTLLKEVDAKIFAPEEALFQLVDAALETLPPPVAAQSRSNDASSNVAASSAPMSSQNSSSGRAPNDLAPQQPPSATPNAFDPSNLPRRQLFRQTAFKIQEMLVSLEEKNHVISTANDALQKQLNRIDDVWPHLEREFSEEAKWGSDTHWAYPENRAARAANTVAERTRREGAASLSAAAQVVDAGDAAARSDARKQAVAAKKSQKNQHQDSDRDDHDGKGKDGTGKKQNTKRKPAAKNADARDSPASIGLGISGQAEASNTPAPKRRKVEKQPANGSTPTMALNAVFSNAKEPKGKASASPRATPNPEQPAPKKQRKALPSSNGQAKKRCAITV